MKAIKKLDYSLYLIKSKSPCLVPAGKDKVIMAGFPWGRATLGGIEQGELIARDKEQSSI